MGRIILVVVVRCCRGSGRARGGRTSRRCNGSKLREKLCISGMGLAERDVQSSAFLQFATELVEGFWCCGGGLVERELEVLS